MIDLFLNLDSSILLFVQELRIPALTPFVVFLTRLGNAGMIWVMVSLFLLIFRQTRKAGCLSLLALLFSFFVNNLILKNLVGRIRPYEAVQGLVLIIEKQADASFPSGHTGCSFASACVLYHCLPKKAGVLALVLAALIGLSRLYVGVHYPTDVLAGMITGIGCGCLAVWLGERFSKNGFGANVI